MELIDRAKVERITFQEPSYSDPINVLTEVRDKVRAIPEVEAIPIEYIESTMNRWKEIIGYEESVDALRILIDNWKVERK